MDIVTAPRTGKTERMLAECREALAEGNRVVIVGAHPTHVRHLKQRMRGCEHPDHLRIITAAQKENEEANHQHKRHEHTFYDHYVWESRASQLQAAAEDRFRSEERARFGTWRVTKS